MARRVADPSLRRALEPKYAMGCKRILLSNDYYPALARSNVQLITHAIAEIRDRTILTDDGTQHEVDTIIFATGFRAADVLAPVRIVGRDGIELNAAWRSGAEAYRGITVSGFPNMFMLMGPNTLLGHNSVVFMIEAQVHYVLQCLKWLRRRPAGAIDLRPAVQARFNHDLRRRSDRSVWASGCKSYYLDDRGRNVTLWPGSTVRYWLLTRRFSPNDYSLLRGASGG
jgi:cation diffusion facilitator CzcD-associated flavoprotein CzcO